MKKKVFVLIHDYWHHSDSIDPLIRLLFEEDFEVTASVDPEDYMTAAPDLLVTFKDPIENDQIPTPVWCGEAWTEKFLKDIRSGMGVLVLHAALTDLPEDHPIVTQVIRAMFVTHPAQCPVELAPTAEHPVLAGVEAFTFPENDEHYVMELLPGTDTELLAETRSGNGVQPGVWAHTLGSGRICCITPGHTTENLTCAPYVKLLKNAAAWCMRK